MDGNRAALIDTPWTNKQTDELIEWVEENLKVKIEFVIVTHSHDDCMGGLAAVHRKGIESYALDITHQKAGEELKPLPHHVFSGETELQLGDKKLVLQHPGLGIQ